MKDYVREQIPDTSRAATPAALLPYQQAWVADASPFKVMEKGRRTGITWAEAADDVLIAAADKSAGGQNVYYIGTEKEMTEEYVSACAMWAKQFNRAADDIEEGFWDEDEEEGDKHIKTYTIRFPDSRHKIIGLASRPKKLRGRQGVLVGDEAAFQEDLNELMKAAMAFLIWGGKVRLISTHDGDQNEFAELCTDLRAGKQKGTLHRVTFRQAVDEGLYQRVCLRTGKGWTQAEQDAWVGDIYDYYRSNADEELDCIPSAGSGAYLTRAMIEAVMLPEIPVLRWAKDAAFTLEAQRLRELETLDWCEANLKPLLAALPKNRDHFLGEDFARSGDLTVLWPLTQLQNLKLHTPFTVELRNIPFAQQQQILWYVLDRLPRFRGAAMDARGNGQNLAEVTMQKYGASRIACVMLSPQWYLDNMPKGKARIEDRTVAIPKDADVLADLRMVKMERGYAKVPDGAHNKGGDGFERHGDSAIAFFMAAFAAASAPGGPIEFESAPTKSTRWDSPSRESAFDDQDEHSASEAVLGELGAW